MYYEFPLKILTNYDLYDLCSFLERYLNKHNINYFAFNIESGDFEVKDNIFKNIIKYVIDLSPNKFEKVSAILCGLLGFKDYFATKASHDQGIDIIGFSNHFKEFFDINSGYKYYIFGQCKKYKRDLVDSSEITSLAGSISNFRTRNLLLRIQLKYIVNST